MPTRFPTVPPKHRTSQQARAGIHWERLFYLVVFPLACWAAIIGGAMIAVWSD